MKIKKLLAKAESIFDSAQRGRLEQKKQLKKILKQLRNYEEKLRIRLQEESDQTAIEKLQRKISLAHAQRKKGLSLMQQIDEDNKSGA